MFHYHHQWITLNTACDHCCHRLGLLIRLMVAIIQSGIVRRMKSLILLSSLLAIICCSTYCISLRDRQPCILCRFSLLELWEHVSALPVLTLLQLSMCLFVVLGLEVFPRHQCAWQSFKRSTVLLFSEVKKREISSSSSLVDSCLIPSL